VQGSDSPVIEAALGSPRDNAVRGERLAQIGVSPEGLERVHGPIASRSPARAHSIGRPARTPLPLALRSKRSR